MNSDKTRKRFRPRKTILLDATQKSAPVEQSAQVGFKQNIHYLRGLAALSVAFFHAALFHQSEYGAGIMPQAVLDLFGIYGVAIFFAISGYLMSSLIQSQSPIEFICRRVLRIYPLFILATVAIMVAHPKIWAEYNLASMSLAPIGETKYPLGKIEWTLVYEVFFYVALFVVSLIGLRRYVSIIAGIWAVVVITAVCAGVSEIPFPTLLELPFRPVCIGLAGGLLAPHLGRIGAIPSLLIAIASPIAVLLISALEFKLLVAGIGAVFLIAAIIRLPVFVPLVVRPIFKKLGDWSYGLYLIHVPVLFISYQPFFKAFGPSYLPLRIAAAVAGGAILGQLDMVIHERSRKLKIDPKGWLTITVVGFFTATYTAIALFYA